MRLLSDVSRHSDIDPLGDCDRIIDLDAEVSNGAFVLRISERKRGRLRIPVRQ